MCVEKNVKFRYYAEKEWTRSKRINESNQHAHCTKRLTKNQRTWNANTAREKRDSYDFLLKSQEKSMKFQLSLTRTKSLEYGIISPRSCCFDLKLYEWQQKNVCITSGVLGWVTIVLLTEEIKHVKHKNRTQKIKFAIWITLSSCLLFSNYFHQLNVQIWHFFNQLIMKCEFNAFVYIFTLDKTTCTSTSTPTIAYTTHSSLFKGFSVFRKIERTRDWILYYYCLW